MKMRLQKWGNSLALRIPKAFTEGLGLETGSQVSLSLEEGALVIKPNKGQAWNLDALLAEVASENIHAEWETEGTTGETEGES
jgi:antitoxin MazE